MAIISTFALAMIGRLQPDMFISILPQSITTPIAIEVSKEIGGLPPLTTVFVIMAAWITLLFANSLIPALMTLV